MTLMSSGIDNDDGNCTEYPLIQLGFSLAHLANE